MNRSSKAPGVVDRGADDVVVLSAVASSVANGTLGAEPGGTLVDLRSVRLASFVDSGNPDLVSVGVEHVTVDGEVEGGSVNTLFLEPKRVVVVSGTRGSDVESESGHGSSSVSGVIVSELEADASSVKNLVSIILVVENEVAGGGGSFRESNGVINSRERTTAIGILSLDPHEVSGGTGKTIESVLKAFNRYSFGSGGNGSLREVDMVLLNIETTIVDGGGPGGSDLGGAESISLKSDREIGNSRESLHNADFRGLRSTNSVNSLDVDVVFSESSEST